MMPLDDENREFPLLTIANSTCLKQGILLDEKQVRSYLDQQVKEAVKRVLEEIMNSEAEELLCAKPYERSSDRQDYRNGSRKRTIKP